VRWDNAIFVKNNGSAKKPSVVLSRATEKKKEEIKKTCLFPICDRRDARPNAETSKKKKNEGEMVLGKCSGVWIEKEGKTVVEKEKKLVRERKLEVAFQRGPLDRDPVPEVGGVSSSGAARPTPSSSSVDGLPTKLRRSVPCDDVPTRPAVVALAAVVHLSGPTPVESPLRSAERGAEIKLTTVVADSKSSLLPPWWRPLALATASRTSASALRRVSSARRTASAALQAATY
jgi:hypothetical protein